MTQPKTNRIPAPLYAAAGAGDLAIEQLRKLPTVVTDLGVKVVAGLGGKAVVTGFELRQRATETLRAANQTATELRGKGVQAELNRLREAADVDRIREAADVDRIRELATRNAAVVVAGAQAAQVRALAAYGELVARGERVVGAGVLEAADTVNADIEATEAELTATPAVTPTATEAPAAAKTDVPTPADVAEVVEAKPAAAKTPRTRATKATAAKATGKTAPKATTDTPSAKLPKPTRRTRPAAE
ncbi:hypothetical protein [Micromonospora rubida]|uniref:hypothetical protein n=1 Tax=Micromonospora rubida TaxID=2697657 RepID=UPI00137906E1|nr:hypothetical protein [Micromonospora rubida]NBE81008.1 hypothetical protein [Micromonospora rubida]